MSDELTSAIATQADSEGQSADGAAPQKPAKVNLFDLPEFRNVQSQWSKQYSEMQKLAQENARQLRDLQLQKMTEADRVQFELDEARAQLNAILQEQEQASQRQLMAQAKQRDLERLSTLSGLTVEDLSEASTYDEAMDMAVKAATKRQSSAEGDAGSTPYIPTGRTATPTSRQEALLNDALKAKDGRAYWKAMLGGTD